MALPSGSNAVLGLTATLNNVKSFGAGINSSTIAAVLPGFGPNYNLGGGANQMNTGSLGLRSVVAGAPDDIDLTITLLAPDGSTCNFSEIIALIIAASTGNTSNILVGDAASNQWSSVDQVNSLVTVDSTGSGTFTLTVEGVTTGAITYSATAATLESNINAALDAAFGSGAIVASGGSLAALVLTSTAVGFQNRPVGTITATILAGSTGYTLNGSGTIGTPSTCPVTTGGLTAPLSTNATAPVRPGFSYALVGAPAAGGGYGINSTHKVLRVASLLGTQTYTLFALGH